MYKCRVKGEQEEKRGGNGKERERREDVIVMKKENVEKGRQGVPTPRGMGRKGR